MLSLPLLLASASPRRHELLKQIGINHTVVHVPAPPGEDEPQEEGETAISYVTRTAAEKAVQAQHYLLTQQIDTEYALLCADTTVELNSAILSKPSDLNDASRMLRLLSDQTHHVHTAVVLIAKGHRYSALSSSQVTMKALSNVEIARYCESGEPLGKAGAYGIQGQAAAFIRHLEGSYSGVMGLPLHETYDLFVQSGLIET